MNWKKLINPKGTNIWVLASVLGWNVLWALLTLFITYTLLSGEEQILTIHQTGMMFSFFFGAFAGSWVGGKVAADNRGPTYGVIGSLGGVVPVVSALVPAGGMFGILAAIVTIAGGLNGGILSVRPTPRD